MTNECTVLDIGWIILSEQPTCKTILPKFIYSMENDLTATIIIYYVWMVRSMAHNVHKTKLVIPSTQPIFSHNTNCFCVDMLCYKPNSVVYH